MASQRRRLTPPNVPCRPATGGAASRGARSSRAGTTRIAKVADAPFPPTRQARWTAATSVPPVASRGTRSSRGSPSPRHRSGNCVCAQRGCGCALAPTYAPQLLGTPVIDSSTTTGVERPSASAAGRSIRIVPGQSLPDAAVRPSGCAVQATIWTRAVRSARSRHSEMKTPPGWTVRTSVAVTPLDSRYSRVSSAGVQRRDCSLSVSSFPSSSSTATVKSGAISVW